MAAGARQQEGPHRVRGALRHPRGRPPPERVHARRPGDPSGRAREAHLDERVVLPTEGDLGRAEPHRGRRRHDRPERGQPERPASYAESKHGIPWVGYDSNAQKSAPTQWQTAAVYNWGPYYLRASRRRMNGTLEARLLLRLDQGRVHGHRAVRPEGHGEDEGADRREAARRSSPGSSTSSRARSTTSRASSR